MSKESFVYIWYDALNKMYYLGSSIGKDPNYAHSSSVMESFTMKTKPAHMHRKILDRGTHEEMLALESKPQANRKERCWDRYYNDNVCDGLYHGFGFRENNPAWKHGDWADKGAKAWRKAYYRTPEYREKNRERLAERRAKNKAETGYVMGYSLAKKKAERQGEGTLEPHIK